MIDEKTEEEGSALESQAEPDTEKELGKLQHVVEELRRRNIELQNKLHPLINTGIMKENNPDKENSETRNGVDDEETKKLYISGLRSYYQAKDAHESLIQQLSLKIGESKEELKQKEANRKEVEEKFAFFKREIAKEARHSRSLRPMNLKKFEMKLLEEEQNNATLKKVKLSNILLQGVQKKLEEEIKSREQVKEGLHLIDFEQFKIENQSLNEKIENRESEVEKLKGKIVNLVQISAHLKEKLHFLSKQNEVLSKEVKEASMSVSLERQRLLDAKRIKEVVTLNTEELNKKMRLISNKILMDDYSRCSEEIEQKKENLAILRDKLSSLNSQ